MMLIIQAFLQQETQLLLFTIVENRKVMSPKFSSKGNISFHFQIY